LICWSSIVITNTKGKAIVIGGSLGGLFVGTLLRRIGWGVDIYERSPHDLDSRGGGIVLQPDVVEVFRRVGAELRDLGVASRDRIVYASDGSLRSRYFAPQTQTSWRLIYHDMRSVFPEAHYHQGTTLIGLSQDEAKVTAKFSDGSAVDGDLLIAADGGRSTVRGLVDPGNDPRYAGYIAWRGLIPEKEVPDAARELLGHFAFANSRGSHMLGYLVPGDDQSTKEGERYYNFVWYRVADETEELPDIMTDRTGRANGFSIPPGMLRGDWKSHVYQEADALLPPAFRAMVHATEEPFAQAILDLTSEQMVYGRVVLIGDAAFIPRPHTAASTSKAAANALGLAEALEGVRNDAELAGALAAWEIPQLRLGQILYRQGAQAGDELLFHTR
jgi:2-polyprenyl-6-methoxyphenol hydroxylase-like FAD-dependent oxidoreductase